MEKSAAQRARELESQRPFLEDSTYSSSELIGTGDFLVVAYDDQLRLAHAFAEERDARFFLKQTLPKMGLSREWTFTLIGKTGPREDSQMPEDLPPEDNDNDENPES